MNLLPQCMLGGFQTHLPPVTNHMIADHGFNSTDFGHFKIRAHYYSRYHSKSSDFMLTN